jgi:hypothetical protein
VRIEPASNAAGLWQRISDDTDTTNTAASAVTGGDFRLLNRPFTPSTLNGFNGDRRRRRPRAASSLVALGGELVAGRVPAPAPSWSQFGSGGGRGDGGRAGKDLALSDREQLEVGGGRCRRQARVAERNSHRTMRRITLGTAATYCTLRNAR